MFLSARVFLLLVTGFQSVATSATRSADCAGLVDIGGGRKMYLKCQGTRSPTVVLVGGQRASAEDWSIANKSAPAVFPEVARFNRVCACDRPGTPVGEKPSRSDPVPLYPALERIDTDRSFDQLRATPPLRSIPLIVLSADRPWGPQIPSMIAAGNLPRDVPPDFGYVTDAAQKKAQEQLAKLVPNAKHITNTNSGHEIHKEQPRLVIDAIREVVETVRNEKREPGAKRR
jgi:hypothetical protein